MGLREYARHRGVSLKAVQRAIDEARIEVSIENGLKKIDAARADRCWDKNTQPRAGNDEDYKKARARREHYQANTAELDYQERVGELMSTARVRSLISKYNGVVREKLMSIPHQLAPQLAGISNVRRVEELLISKINDSLTNLAEEKDIK